MTEATYAVDDNLMAEIVRRIVAAARPQKVILFGSRGRGEARPESDIDLLVVSEDARPRAQRASDLYGVLSDIIIPMDILVYRPDEIADWRNVPQAFVTTAVREGRVLYEDHGYAGFHSVADGESDLGVHCRAFALHYGASGPITSMLFVNSTHLRKDKRTHARKDKRSSGKLAGRSFYEASRS